MAGEPQGDQSAAPQQQKAKKAISPARTVIGLVLLVAFTIVAFLEVSAIRGYNDAVGKLKAALEKEEAGLLSRTEVETMIGRSADGPVVTEKAAPVSYTWRGALRRHRITAVYNDEKTPRLLSYSTD